MKKTRLLLSAVLVLALVVTGAEASPASRKKEKAETYAALKPWQKKYVDTGVIALAFTSDMVYISIGKPSAKETAGDEETWVYKNYYPSVEADKVKRTYNTESHYQASRSETDSGTGRSQPRGTGRSGGPSASATGGPQGQMDLGDLPSYTLWVTYKNGVVSKIKLDPNQ